jgi:hypothetical protein
VTIVPDGKDWTWVLQRPCPECGFDTSGFPREDVAGMVTANAAAWHDVLTGPDALLSRSEAVRIRPAADRWSALEYGCHVRDVLRLYDYRLGLILTQDDPLFPNWDQDETAVAERYGEQDPAVVAGQLTEAAQVIAAHFGTVSGEQWERTGNRSDGAVFTTETFARYFVHDPVHHLHDVTGVRQDSTT